MENGCVNKDPSDLLVSAQVSGGQGIEDDSARCRRVSSASCPEAAEVEAVPPEAAAAHSALVDLCLSCVSVLAALSPPLPDLLTGAALLDRDQWRPLLAVTFNSPGPEDQQVDQLGYGALLALANTAVRTLTREHARSPSPGRGSSRPVKQPSTADTVG